MSVVLKAMLLSIVILNHDTRELLKRCLDSIPTSSQDFPLEIIIVNNGSPNDTAESLSGLHPQAVVYDLPVNVGFGRGNNLGVSKARGEYVLLLNSDTYFLENSLPRALDFIQSEPDVDIFGCAVLNPDGSPQPQHHNRVTRNRSMVVFRMLFKENALVEKCLRVFSLGGTKKPVAPYWLTGCSIFLKRSVYEETRGFDPDFFLYHEEAEWFYNRIFDRGYRVEICPEIKLVHLRGASQTPRNRNSQLALSSFLFFYKLGWGPFLMGLFMTLVNMATRAACVPFVPSRVRENVRIIRDQCLLLSRVLREVPSSPRGYGARPAPLMTRSNQKAFPRRSETGTP